MPGRATVFRWIACHKEFRDEYILVRELRAEDLGEEIVEIADDPCVWVEKIELHQALAALLLCALYAPDPGSSLHSWLPDGVEHLTADGDRLGRHQHKGDDARRRALVHPVVDGAPLHQHVAGLEAHAGAVELHVDLA